MVPPSRLEEFPPTWVVVKLCPNSKYPIQSPCAFNPKIFRVLPNLSHSHSLSRTSSLSESSTCVDQANHRISRSNLSLFFALQFLIGFLCNFIVFVVVVENIDSNLFLISLFLLTDIWTRSSRLHSFYLSCLVF